MPTYEYACTACAHEWEFEQSIRADPLTDCPKCHGQTARRQISRGTGFILKGSGWYSDLYSSSSNKKEESKTETKADTKSTDSGTKPAESKSSETKSETKGSGSGPGKKGDSSAAAA